MSLTLVSCQPPTLSHVQTCQPSDFWNLLNPPMRTLSTRSMSEKPSCPTLRVLTEEIELWNISLNQEETNL